MDFFEPKILYQEANPYESMSAFLEADGRTIYLYLQSHHNPEYPMKALWVKNTQVAPLQLEKDKLRNGNAPMLCMDEVEQPDLNPLSVDEIHFLWTEEGDGVALFQKEELIAFLPPWSGMENVHGYSKYCKKEALTASPLGDGQNGILAERIQKSREFWKFRSQPNSWKSIQERRLAYLEERLGKHTKYWSADGGKFPKLGIAQFQPSFYDNVVVYSTIGMSAQNMPGVEFYYKDYLAYSRIELVFALNILDSVEATEIWVPHLLGEIIKYPWMMHKWFGEAHIISMPRKDRDGLLPFSYLFLTSSLDGTQTYPLRDTLNSENGYPIRFLTCIPITEEEMYYFKTVGSKKFIEILKDKNQGWIHSSIRDPFV